MQTVPMSWFTTVAIRIGPERTGACRSQERSITSCRRDRCKDLDDVWYDHRCRTTTEPDSQPCRTYTLRETCHVRASTWGNPTPLSHHTPRFVQPFQLSLGPNTIPAIVPSLDTRIEPTQQSQHNGPGTRPGAASPTRQRPPLFPMLPLPPLLLSCLQRMPTIGP